MTPSCIRCGQNDTSPRNVLLVCAACSRAYHHRHHKPPVQDGELIARINAGSHPEKGLKGWTCATCTQAQRHRLHTSKQVIEILSSEDEGEPSRPPAPSAIVTVDLTDDDVEVLPSTNPSSHQPEVSFPRRPEQRPSGLLLPSGAVNLASCTGAFTPPPWYHHRTPDSNFDFLLNTRSSTSSRPHRPRKPLPKTLNTSTRHYNFAFDITSWKNEMREEFGSANVA